MRSVRILFKILVSTIILVAVFFSGVLFSKYGDTSTTHQPMNIEINNITGMPLRDVEILFTSDNVEGVNTINLIPAEGKINYRFYPLGGDMWYRVKYVSGGETVVTDTKARSFFKKNVVNLE